MCFKESLEPSKHPGARHQLDVARDDLPLRDLSTERAWMGVRKTINHDRMVQTVPRQVNTFLEVTGHRSRTPFRQFRDAIES